MDEIQKSGNGWLPYRMILFPLPAIIAIVVWMFIFFSSGLPYILGALGVIASGVIVYYFFKGRKKPLT